MANAPSVVLVTGVGRYLGARVAARLGDDPAVERVIGVDTIPPLPGPGRTEFVRADIGHPLIGKVLDQAGVDTLVHVGARAADTAALLAASQQSRALRAVVATSSVAGYGGGRRDPAVFTEQTPPSSDLAPGPARTAAAAEAALRSYARRRPDVRVRALRLAPVLGPGIDTWLTRYLDRPVVPSAFGFDPRLQVLHEFDAVEATIAAVRSTRSVDGAINVAGRGVVALSQAVRIAGRVRLPLPGPLLDLSGVAPAEAGALLRYGRVVDTTKLTAGLGYVPRYTTLEAIYNHVGSHVGALRLPGLAAAALAGAERMVGT